MTAIDSLAILGQETQRMELNDAEVQRLRGQLLEFLIGQLKAAAASGDLAQVREQLAVPIAAEVEAAVGRAMAIRPVQPAPTGLSEVDLKRIAEIVARAVPAQQKVGAAPIDPVQHGFPEVEPDVTVTSPPEIAEQLAPGAGLGHSGGERHGDSMSGQSDTTAMPQWLRAFGPVIVALLSGGVIGYVAAQMMAPAVPSQAGMEDAVVVSESPPVETGAAANTGVAPVGDPATAGSTAAASAPAPPAKGQ